MHKTKNIHILIHVNKKKYSDLERGEKKKKKKKRKINANIEIQ